MLLRKRFIIAILLVVVLVLSSCSSTATGPTQEEYDAIVTELETAKEQIKDSEDALKKVQKEFEEYKEKMSVYEQLAEAEAQAELARLEEEARRKAEEEEAKAAAEREQKAAEEAKGYETGITYAQLARTPDEYKGKKVKFSGRVIQVIEDAASGSNEVQIRLAVNDDYDTIVYAEYAKSTVSSRVLEDDEITIYGTSVGTISYQSTLGGTITIPGVYVDKIDQ